MSGAFSIGTAVAQRGAKMWGEVPVPERYSGVLKPPWVVVVNGSSDGPVVYIGAGTHGDEYNSMQAVQRAAATLDPAAVRGTVILVPVVNRAALEARQRHSPADGRDLDSCYPGDPAGTASEALAHLLFNEAICKAEYALDLHTATRGGYNLPNSDIAPRTPAASAIALQMATWFGARAIITLEASEGPVGQRMGWNLDHSLFVQTTAHGIPCPILEFGEGGRLDGELVEFGLQGILNVLAGLHVLDAEIQNHPAPFVAPEAVAVRATTQGFLYLAVRAGARVKQGQVLARVVSFSGDTEEIISPCKGMAIRETTEGMVMPEERVMVVAADNGNLS